MKLTDLSEGSNVLPPIDRERYTDIPDLEGPFMGRNGKVYYYDPREGKYYDRDTDMYMSDEEVLAMDESVDEQAPHWEADSKKPKAKKPPRKGNTSPHPARGKMVGEGSETERVWKTRGGKWANSVKGGFNSEAEAQSHIDSHKKKASANKISSKNLKPRNEDAPMRKLTNEAPIVATGDSSLHQIIHTLFDDFMSGNPSKDQLAQMLSVMGKSMDSDGKRSVIDQLKQLKEPQESQEVNEMFPGADSTGVKFFHVDDKVYKDLQGWFPGAKIQRDPKRQIAIVRFGEPVSDELDSKIDRFNSNWRTRSMYIND